LVLEDGTGHAPTIQAAFDSSAVGDSILVGPGTYRGHVDALGGRSLLGRDGAAATILDADGDTSCLYSFPSDFNFLIEGFTLIGAQESYGYADPFAVGFTGPGSVEVRGCIFEETECGAIATGAETRVVGCEVRNGSGIFFSPDSYGASLLIEDCLFENNIAQSHGGEAAIVQIVPIGSTVKASVRSCTFRHNQNGFSDRPIIGFDYGSFSQLEFELVGCLFHDNDGPAVGFAPLSIINGPRHGAIGNEEVYIHSNTIVRSGGLRLDEIPATPTRIYVEYNIITGGAVGVVMPVGATHFQISCDNVWNNGQNWVGFADPTGMNSCISLPPLFCNPSADVFTLAANSPCLPPASGCGIIGALGQGCGTVSVESKSWGQIKGLYR
jgi:hypothetical protein